ncbi:transmembrane protein, putative [Bodo saltans]|uniref:Transmembrane protein, putative n=1 Tax=Bodo saltans TaxID=75058 RepID=A0A0S4J3P7_BODSA|nr:transmembrane protein, putative [Bodo saltans]|eukprot:CUG39300.1 transmembrane protein, putative [Bodo saltans]
MPPRQWNCEGIRANTAPSSPAVVGAVLLGCVGNCTISESATIQVNAVASPEPSLKSSSMVVALRAVLGGVLSRVILEESSRLSVHRAVFTAQEDRYLPMTAAKHHAQQFASSRLLYGLVYFMWGNSTATPLLLVSSSARITLNQSVLYGFDSALLKIAQSSSSSSSSSQQQTSAFAVDGYLELGCNLWSGGTTASFSSNEPIALPWQLVGLPRGPRRHIVYVPSTFDGGEAFNASSSHCVGLPTESESISMHTTSMQLVPPAVIDVNPSPSLSKGTTGTVAAATGAAILVSLVGGGVGGISIDLQLLAIFGRSSCAPEALKTATGPSQWLLSPFYLLPSVWMVVGNCAVVGAVILLQLAVVRVISSRSSKAAPSSKPQNAIITLSAAQKTDGKARLEPHSATVTPSFGSTASADNHVTTSPAALESPPHTSLYSWRQDHISGTHHHSHHLTTATASNTAARRARWELACTRARFPQLSYSVGMLMVSGVVSSSTTILIFDGIENGDATFGVVGAIGLCLVLCGTMPSVQCCDVGAHAAKCKVFMRVAQEWR